MEEETFAGDFTYIAVAPCGCVYAAHMVNDREGNREAVARFVHGEIIAGGHIERATPDAFRDRFEADCPHEPRFGGLDEEPSE